MIDYEMYNWLHPKLEGPPAQMDEDVDALNAVKGDNVPDEDSLLTLPAYLRGYSFHDKEWR